MESIAAEIWAAVGAICVLVASLVLKKSRLTADQPREELQKIIAGPVATLKAMNDGLRDEVHQIARSVDRMEGKIDNLETHVHQSYQFTDERLSRLEAKVFKSSG